MRTVKEGVLRGSFAGFHGPGTLFEFSDGERWSQICLTVHPRRLFMPDAQISVRENKYFIKVDGIDLAIQVIPEP